VSGFPDAARVAAAHVFVDDLDAPSLGEEDRHHLERVLRLRNGELVSAVDGRGGWRLCAYSGVGRSTAAGSGRGLDPRGEILTPPAPSPEITIGLALTKGDRPEWAVQKLTEIGVDRIVPLVTGRSVVRWDGQREDRHLTRLREVARQAAMQSRRLRLPVVERVRTLAELGSSSEPGLVALAVPGGDPPTLLHPTVLVGPEGGWTPEEERDARATVGLGPSVLRTETAAVVAASLLSALRAGLLSGDH
jgi:16S rRNA (uracil1498-N3)-methyltransferase